MRILQVVHGFPPQEWAGVEVVTYYLAKGLHARGHEVTIFCREQDLARAEGSVREEKYAGLRVVYAVNNFPAYPVFRSYYDNPRFDAIFTDLLRQVDPHGVHFQHLIGHAPSLVRLAAQAGYPTILSLHDYYYLCHRVQLLTASGTLCDGPAAGERCVACLSYLQAGDDARQRFSFMGEVLATPRLILSPSAFLRDRYLQHYPFLADHLRVLPHGVRVVGKAERKSSTPPLRFLYLGALLPHKGVHLLLQALQGLPQGTVEVVICGHTPQGAEAYREHLRQEAEGLPVRFAGPYGPAELPQVLAQGDVVVAPSMWDEAFALVVREAFGAGLPVIASRIGALPEAVQDGVNGLLFPPGNVEVLREALLRCATDSELLTRLRQGVPPVKGMAEYVAEMETVYHEVFHDALVTAEQEPRATARPVESQAVEGKTAMETTQPLVSIVIPTYNHASYVAETIDSVLRQTYRNWELIIIDDGSTDATPEIMQRYTDPRIRAYRQENRGLSATVNRGIELARGKYFAFLPSDDVYEPDKLAVQVPVLEENPAVGVVFSWQTVIDAEGKPSTEQHVQKWFAVSFETKEEIFPALFERDFLSTPTHLLRMECFARVGRFDESLVTAQDYDLWLRILQYYDVRLLKRPLVKMRWHGQNQTRGATSQTELERATVLLKAFRALAIEEIFPALTGIAADTYPEVFAHAYLTLARHIMRNGLSEMVPAARIYLTQALRHQPHLKIPEELQPLIVVSPGLCRQASLRETREGEKLEEQATLPRQAEDTAGLALARGENREKINVLVEVPTLDKGGVEQVVFAMVSALPKEIFRFLIVCVDGGGYMAERCRRHGIPVEVLRGDKEAAYRELLERYHADLVVTHYAHFGLPIACQMGIPVVTFVHGIYAWFRAGLLGEMGGWDQYITRYVAISQDVADYLTHRFHIPREKVCVIHNGIEMADALENEEEVRRADWGLRPEDYVFLNVAALSPAKGHFALLEALRRVAPTHPEVKVLCVGQVLDEEYFQRVLAKRRRDQLEDRLIFAGFQPNVSPFYRLADAFIFPSVLEGFGLVKLEAMAHGLPLILTRVGDSDKLIVHSDIGLLIPNSYADLYDLDQDSVIAHLTDESPANTTDLAAAMAEFVTHREHWRTAGQQGREQVLRSFTRERALKSYEALFLREVFLDQRKRAKTEEQVEKRHLRNQVALLERILQEKDHVLQEKDHVLQEKDHVLQEKDHVLQEKDHILQEKDERFTTLTRQVDRQQEQLTMQQRVVEQSLRELQRLSLTIFDRLDLTKRVREFRTRVFWGLRRRLPRSVKSIAKSLVSRIEAMRRGRAEQLRTEQIQFSAQLTDTLAQHKTARDVILFAPSVHWNLPLFQRPHQLALAFARSGCLVFFCEPPYSEDYSLGFHPITEGLYVANVPLETFHSVSSPIVFVLSYNVFDLSCLNNARCVYDYIDELDVFPGERKVLEQNHQHLLQTAALVVGTAERLWCQVKASRPDALLCPNGVDYSFIRRALETTTQPPEDLVRVLRPAAPVIGYYGALAEWFDYELLMHVAAERPAYEFVLIGPNYDGSLTKSRIEQAKNIHWLGPRPYSQLPQYLQYFDVATIPFKLNEITHSTSPVKLFEYMAGGKPVVTTAMHESTRFAGVVVARDAEDFACKLDEALQLRTDPEYLHLIDRVARENTWEVRAQQILDALPPKRAESAETALAPAPLALQGQKFPKLLGELLQYDRLDEITNPTKRMWIDFALSTNERGRNVVNELEQCIRINGKKFLDVGCAYAGFLVAFAAKGAAQVTGIDINPDLLRLAAANLEDFHVSASLYQQDLLDPEILQLGKFDIITCNDVIEHVKDPPQAISHLSHLLEDGGVLYMEIPNRYFIGFIKEDGHYRLPGITLLPRQRAAKYHFLNFGDAYGVEFYRKLDYYLLHLTKQGLSPILLNKEPGRFDAQALDGMFQEALRSFDSFQEKQIEPTLAEEIRVKGRKIYEIFSREVQAYQTLREQNPRGARDLAGRIHLRYGVDFWRVIARK